MGKNILFTEEELYFWVLLNYPSPKK